jgi:Calcineurin-like phosphoesterase
MVTRTHDGSADVAADNVGRGLWIDCGPVTKNDAGKPRARTRRVTGRPVARRTGLPPRLVGTLGIAAYIALALSFTAGAASASSAGFGSGPGPLAVSPYGGFNSVLARAPYVTDLTQTSAVVTWATNLDIHGSLYYGSLGNCTANSIPVMSGMVTQVRVSPNPTTTYQTRYDYQSSVSITGLSAGMTYCYEVFGSGATAVDLLPAARPYQTFTTLDPITSSSTAPLTFDVVGDFGETANRGSASDASVNNPTSVNSNQAAIDSLIGSSGARFMIGVGDIAYNDGGNYNYGDLEETGTSVGTPNLTEISDIFGPSYWPLTDGMPMFTAGGNHGQNSNILTTWPEATTSSISGGAYAMQQYPSVDGTAPASYPSDWYAFSSGNARFYILDGSWSDANVGTATGAACPYSAGSTNCKTYQVDADAHFLQSDPEYQWLANDLHAHPGGIKLAFFHYPLRSDNATQDSDVYLQQDLEPLLAQYGVDIAFTAHAHDYERNTKPGPNTILSYVTGGGGGVISTVRGKGCSSWDAYAIGWTYSSDGGQKCGSAPTPTSDAQVYNFLKVTVSGNTVTVDPINATGQEFDQQAYTFTTPVPSRPSSVVATATAPTVVQMTWGASTETGGTIASYQISRNATPLASVSGSVTSYVDFGAQPGTSYTYSVTAIDRGGTASQPGTSNAVTTPLMMAGFESGDLTGWSPTVGQIAVQAGTAHTGSHAAALTSTGGQTFALQTLSVSSATLYAQGWINIVNQSTAVTIFGLRTQATVSSPAYQVAQVYLNAGGTIKILNNVSRISYLGNTTLTSGGWHELTFAVNQTMGTMQVWLDGSPVQFATPAGWTAVVESQNLGSVPMSNFQLGDDSTGRVYSWYADDLTVSNVRPAF